MSKTVEVRVPDIGDYKDVPVIEILVQEGQRVEKDSALLALESEKATMEVPSPEAGVVRAIRVKVGGKVSQGDVIMTLEAAMPERAAPEAVKTPAPAIPAPATQKSADPAPRKAAAAAAQKLEVSVPDIGDYTDVPVIEVLVKDGDAVEKDAPLIVLESEKSTMEIPAPIAGTVRSMKLRAGAKVSKGALICVLETADSDTRPASPAPESVAASPAQPQPANHPTVPARNETAGAQPPWIAQAGNEIPHASPMVRRVARDFGVDLRHVSGSGPNGRILQEDVQGFVKQNLASPGKRETGSAIPPIPAVDFSQYGEIESKPLSRIRKFSAAHLTRAWLNIPHVTQFDEADITELETFRKTQSEELSSKDGGAKLTLLPFLMKAAGAALKAHAEFNASLAPDGEGLILKKYCHIGFAADTEHGLVVPVVRDIWSKGIVQLAAECGELAKKARDGKLKPDEMKGGCFSISSLGGLGVTGGFTPIVNAPEVAILGVSRATMKPVWNGKDFAPRLMLPLSLSYDHRVIDGAYAARFMVYLTKALSDLRRLAL